MRNSRLFQFGFGLALGATLLVGCATTKSAKGPSDEEQIAALQQACLDAVAANDVDALLSLFADDFDNSYLGNKTAFASFLQMAKDQGYFDGIEIDMAGAALTLEDDSALLYPVAVEGSFGFVTIGFDAQKRNGEWLITGMDLEM